MRDQAKNLNGFIEDNFNLKSGKDILNREGYANKIGFKILGTESLEKAFVIAVNSPWGFGKSGFLLLLEDFFKQSANKSTMFLSVDEIALLNFSKKNVIIVRYNPWKNFDDKKIVHDFFDELSSAISKYDYKLSKKIKQYGKELTKLDDNVFFKFVEIAIDLINDSTLTGLFDEINNSLQRIKKKIIVFVDDLDRLTGDELIDILKLIRNTANFRNTFFILAYDHNYILNTIEKKELISNKEEYLQKIVQLEVTLPTFQKSILIQFLEEQIRGQGLLAFDFDKIQLAIKEVMAIDIPSPSPSESKAEPIDFTDILNNESTDNSLLFRVFQNLRDVVRFTNSFKISFESIGQFADIFELLLLEILKIKYLSIYQLISNKKFLIMKDQKYEFHFELFDRFFAEENEKEINIKKGEIEVVRVVLVNLFSPIRTIYFRSVKYPRYFDIYFSYQGPSLVQLEKIETALKSQNIDEVIKVIDNSTVEGTFDDLKNFLDSQTEFSSKLEFEMMFRSLFYLSKYDHKGGRNSLLQIRSILRNTKVVDIFYEKREEEFLDLLISILKENKYHRRTRAEIAGDELYGIVNMEEQNIELSLQKYKKDLQDVLLKCLDDEAKEAKEFDMELFNYYIKNLKKIEAGTRQIVITDEANMIMKNFILSHKFQYFKEYLLREHPEPSNEGRYFHLDPFLPHYFGGDWDSIKDQLTSSEIQNSFKKEENGQQFYEFLVQTVDRLSNTIDGKLLEKDIEKVKLAEKFIAILDKRRTLRQQTVQL